MTAATTAQVTGLHQCWYPIARSVDVAVGQLINVELGDGLVVCYRGATGRAQVMTAYCPHLGANLVEGEVIGDDVRCGFHHWQYGPDGGCVLIPASPNNIPKGARTVAFPTVETLGLIWAFYGETPLYDVPYFDGYASDDLAFEIEERNTLPGEPWTLLTNSMDFQHLSVVHDFTIEIGDGAIVIGDYGITEDITFISPVMGRLPNTSRAHGTNAIGLVGDVGGTLICQMIAMRPIAGGRSLPYMIIGVLSSLDAQAQREAHGLGRAVALSILEDDERISRSISFRDGLLIGADRWLVAYLRYARAFPRSEFGATLMR